MKNRNTDRTDHSDQVLKNINFLLSLVEQKARELHKDHKNSPRRFTSPDLAHIQHELLDLLTGYHIQKGEYEEDTHARLLDLVN